MCVMWLTAHPCQGKGKFRRIGDLSGAFGVPSRVSSRAGRSFAGQIRMARGTRHGHRPRRVRNLAAMRLWWSGRRSLAVLCAGVLVLAGCAQFNNAQSQPFTTEPERHAPPSSSPPPPPPLPDKPFPKQCPAPGVMQGCLESTSGLLMQPDSKSALVAERTTGAVKEVSVSAEPKVKTVIPVDPAGDGGLFCRRPRTRA